MTEKLFFQKAMDAKSLVAKSTYECIEKIFSKEEQEEILVAEISPNYMDGIKLCGHYGIDIKLGVNCLICECKRGESKSFVALLVPTGYCYNMSSTVRKYCERVV